ncbi:E3 ubiquitin-protein ligase RNF8 isoform X2 [Pleurodeles waltl]|uniref:E3 ubiquitin-protein ligase RNF8 isoform X2 n=1 Tax=Pleurodeles waltl TaxID=8319 RepID=UPI00370970DC
MAGSSQKESDRCWCLRRSGMHAEWLLLENNTEVTIGRGLGLTYQLVSKKCPLMVSRTHCFLRQNEEGHWTITDNKSLNGVYLNKERLAPLKAYPIREGDQIQLGVPLEDGERAEYEYELIHDERGKLEPFLTDQLKSKMKCHRTKRKFSAHELDTSGAEGSSNSKSKALRVSWDGEQPSMPSQRAELVKQPTENMGSKLPAPGPSILNASQADCRAQEKEVLLGTQVFETVVPFGTQTGLKSTLHDKGMKSANSAPSRSTVQLSKVRETMQEIRKLKMRVQEKQTAVLSVKQQNKKRAQKEVREMERELQELHDQLRNEQEQQLQRVKQLEKTFFEEEKQMEGGSSSEGDDSLKDQLAQALQEHTLLMEELNRSKKDFEQIIQAKNKELQATMEEKEKVQAQKEEALNQMNIVLDNELQCIICSEHFIEEWIKRKVECPICRQEIVTQTRSLVLDNCIERMMENLSHEMKQHRLALIKQRKDDKGTTGSQIAQQKQESDVRRPLDPLDAIAEERIEGEEGHSIAGTARRGLPQDTPSSDNMQGGDNRPQTVQEAAAEIPGPSRTPPESPQEQEQEMGEAHTTPGPSPTASCPEPAARQSRRHRRRVLAVPQEEIREAAMSGIEASLLTGQRLQTRQLRSISSTLHRMESNMTTGLAEVNTQFTRLNDNVGDLTQAIRQPVTELEADRRSARRRERHTMARFDRMSAAIGRLATNTTGLSRRTVSLQVELVHFAGDVARGLGRISHAVDLMEARQVARGTGETPQDSEEGSIISSVSASDTRVLRSASARQGSADPPGMSHAGRTRRRV